MVDSIKDNCPETDRERWKEEREDITEIDYRRKDKKEGEREREREREM